MGLASELFPHFWRILKSDFFNVSLYSYFSKMKMKKMKILKSSENVRNGTLIPASGVSPWPRSFFHIFGVFEISAIFLRKPIALLFENEKKISEKIFLRKPIALLFKNEKKKSSKSQKCFLRKPIA